MGLTRSYLHRGRRPHEHTDPTTHHPDVANQSHCFWWVLSPDKRFQAAAGLAIGPEALTSLAAFILRGVESGAQPAILWMIEILHDLVYQQTLGTMLL